MTFIRAFPKIHIFFIISYLWLSSSQGRALRYIHHIYLKICCSHKRQNIYRKPHNKFWMAHESDGPRIRRRRMNPWIRESVSHPEFIFLILLGSIRISPCRISFYYFTRQFGASFEFPIFIFISDPARGYIYLSLQNLDKWFLRDQPDVLWSRYIFIISRQY